MKSLLLSIGLALASVVYAAPSTRPVTAPVATRPATTVYICGTSEVYHTDESCSALKRCTHTITTTTDAAAQKDGKRICKKCE